MECDEARPRLEAYLDGELATGERDSLAEHIAACPHCRPEAEAIERLRAEIRSTVPDYRARPALRRRIRTALRAEAAGAPPTLSAWGGAPGWLAYAFSLLLAVALGSGGTWLITGERQQNTVADELIDDHLRSLLAGHLTDVQSSDKHTVKPWFAGKTDLSPPGVDLAAQGFPLIGGRLDLVAGKPVPALVYRHGAHVINVFVLPAQAGDLGAGISRRGYNLRHWDEGDLGYWIVSDADPHELDKFEQAFRAAARG